MSGMLARFFGMFGQEKVVSNNHVCESEIFLNFSGRNTE
jgi:hypothetical protein